MIRVGYEFRELHVRFKLSNIDQGFVRLLDVDVK